MKETNPPEKPTNEVFAVLEAEFREGKAALVRVGVQVAVVDRVQLGLDRRGNPALAVAMKETNPTRGRHRLWFRLPRGAVILSAGARPLAVLADGPKGTALIEVSRPKKKAKKQPGPGKQTEQRLVAGGTRFVTEQGQPIGYRTIIPISEGSNRTDDSTLRRLISEVLSSGLRVFALKNGKAQEVAAVSLDRQTDRLKARFILQPDPAQPVPSYDQLNAGKAPTGPKPFTFTPSTGADLLVSPFGG